MTDPHRLLTELSKRAREDNAPIVDVRQRVMETLAVKSVAPDIAPLAFGVVAAAIAASVVFVLLPVWQTMSEPWVCYFPL